MRADRVRLLSLAASAPCRPQFEIAAQVEQ